MEFNFSKTNHAIEFEQQMKAIMEEINFANAQITVIIRYQHLNKKFCIYEYNKYMGEDELESFLKLRKKLIERRQQLVDEYGKFLNFLEELEKSSK